MTRLEITYKFISYTVTAVLIYCFCEYIGSVFLNSFNSDFINLITTIFAINVASTSIVFSKLKEINNDIGINFSEARGELRIGFRNQIILIGLSFVIQLPLNSPLVSIGWLDLILNSISIVIFIYFLEITYDLGKSIIELFTSNEI